MPWTMRGRGRGSRTNGFGNGRADPDGDIELSIQTSAPPPPPPGKDCGSKKAEDEEFETGLVSPRKRDSWYSKGTKRLRKLSSPKSLRQLRSNLKQFGTHAFVKHFGGSVSKMEHVASKITKRNKLEKRYLKRSCLLVPGSKVQKIWNFVVLVTLIYTVVYTPLQSSMRMGDTVSNPTPWLVTFFCDRCVDIVFVVDVFLFFRTVEIDATGDYWFDAGNIFEKKSRTLGFYAELIAAAPIDVIVGLSIGGRPRAVERILRLLKLFKTNRLLDILWSMESRLLSQKGPFQKCIFVATFCGVVHWIACGWIMVSYSVNEDTRWTNLYADDDSSQIYSVAVYWSLMTLTTVGYGDITPALGNNGEMLYNAIIFVLGAVSYSFVMGKIIEWVQDKTRNAFDQASFDLDHVMTELQFDENLRKRVWNYLFYIREKELLVKKAEAIKLLSPSLRKECALAAYFSAIEHIPLIHDLIDSKESVRIIRLITDIATKVCMELYGPDEVICETDEECGHLFMIRDGRVMIEATSGVIRVYRGYNGHDWRSKHRQGSPRGRETSISRSVSLSGLMYPFCFGECSVVFRRTSARSLIVTQTFCNITKVSKSEMMEVWARFPRAHCLAKRYCARLRLREIAKSGRLVRSLKRLGGVFGIDVGVRVLIVKPGSRFFGALATVLNMNWSGRIKVRMNDDGAVKSYEPQHLQTVSIGDMKHPVASSASSKTTETKTTTTKTRSVEEADDVAGNRVSLQEILSELREQRRAIQELSTAVVRLEGS